MAIMDRHVDVLTTAHTPPRPPSQLDTDGESLSLKELERELPIVEDGQIPLSDLMSRVVQSVFAEMTEIAETMPSMSDQARKRTLADFCVKTKKQIAKLYAVMRWSRDAALIQKCMNLTAFILNHAGQLDEAISSLDWTKESLAAAQTRNHDLLTSIDVLMTGNYRRLPSVIKNAITSPGSEPPTTTSKLLSRMECLIRFKLRSSEVLPAEMSQLDIRSGRVYFTVPRLFETSLTLSGSTEHDGWLFGHVNFLCSVDEASSSTQDFPSSPSGLLRQFIQDEANSQLRYYLPSDSHQTARFEPSQTTRVGLPKGVVDAPLVRLYNFLQIMSLAYQLEILCFQAYRLRSLGWSDSIRVQVTKDRKELKVDYWLPNVLPTRSSGPKSRTTIGGSLVISIVPIEGVASAAQTIGARQRILSGLRDASQLETRRRASDSIERSYIDIKWDPTDGALGTKVSIAAKQHTQASLVLVPSALDFEKLLLIAIRHHTRHVLASFRETLLSPSSPCSFTSPEQVLLNLKAENWCLEVSFTREDSTIVSIDARTGKILVKALGESTSPDRHVKLLAAENRLNQSAHLLAETLARLRYQLALDNVEHKSSYLGLKCFRQRNLGASELSRFGMDVRGLLYIQLHPLRSHYLTVVVTIQGYRFALIGIHSPDEGPDSVCLIKDFGWVDPKGFIGHHGNYIDASSLLSREHSSYASGPISSQSASELLGHGLTISQLRELYSFCCARVNYLLIEQQLKAHGFAYSHVSASNGGDFGLSGRMPSLCVKASHILAGAEGMDAVERNVRIIAMSWWKKDKSEKVLTCVRLKGIHSSAQLHLSLPNDVLRPSPAVVYDARTGVVTVLSPKVDGCVLHFLAQWSKVSKTIVIAQQVSQMATSNIWSDVKLLSFNLRAIQLEYSRGYGLTITCCVSSAIMPTYELQFFRVGGSDIASDTSALGQYNMLQDLNPHQGIATWAARVLAGKNLSRNVRILIYCLRTSVFFLTELHALSSADGADIYWYPKGLVWWRVLFRNASFGLDFRIRSDFFLEVLDIGIPEMAPHLSDPSSPIMSPIPNMHQICRLVSLSHASLPVISFESGILIPCFGNPEECNKVICSFLKLIKGNVGL